MSQSRFPALPCVSLLTLALVSCGAPSVPPAVAPPPVQTAAPTPAPELAALTRDQAMDGFVTRALYVDEDGRARGARFVHTRTGFVFDYLAIDTAPQVMLYVSTYPAGERGEPHTQEHLLLGKGNKGRWLGNVEHATFSRENAFTTEHRTVYGFSTSAGADTFWRLFRTYLDALLRPDYGDEEIRREVRNFGVGKQPDGSLALDEKGTVYNEMVTAYESAPNIEWHATQRLIYGDGHPLANDSGGSPEGIRELTPEMIRAFHAAHYRLGNMGVVGAFPAFLSLQNVLTHVGALLDSFEPKEAPKDAVLTAATLPPFRPAAPGTIRTVEYPYATADHPSPATLSWPATRALDLNEKAILDSFLEAFSGGAGSTLYKALVDRSTRVLDLDAKSVWQWARYNHGQPVSIGVDDIGAAHTDEASMKALRDVIRAQLEAIASFPDGSSELAAFDDRVRARIVDDRRSNQKRLDTPPQFGERQTNEDWIQLLDEVTRAPGFRKSLTYHDPLAAALAAADPAKNAWRDRIRTWGLLDVPYVVVSRPSPTMRKRLDQERDARVAAERARLEAQYGTHDVQEALRKREAEITAATAQIAKEEASVPMAPLAPDPPMTNDDLLKWTQETRGGVTRVVSTFETMKSATVGLALRLDGITEESLPWLGVLASLASQVGVIKDGLPIAYDDVQDRLRREVLRVDMHFSVSTYSGRTELVIEASGNDVDETKRALGWVRTFLATPDWREANLARIRDLLENRFADYHGTMSGPEEQWVTRVEEAYRRQDRPVLLHTNSYLTRAHDAFVTSWQVEGGDEAKGVAPFLVSLATAGKKLDRASLAKLAAALASPDPKGAADPKIAPWVRAGSALSKSAQSRVRKAGRDLGQLLGDLPDSSLGADWADLCGEMAKGVAHPPKQGLDALARTLAAIRHVDNARVWVVGSSAHQAAIADDLDQTIASLDASPTPRVTYAPRPRVLDRARGRGVKDESPFIALVNPNKGSASLVHSAPLPGLDEARPEQLADYLAVNVFSGEGTHSFYKRIWGAALAYSGWVGAWPELERKELYSDRSSDLPQLLRFVDAEVRRAPIDPRFVDYAIVPAFYSRVAGTFEERAGGVALDLAEGLTPDRIRSFRTRILALRERPGLAAEMHERFLPAMSSLIPSLSTDKKPAPGALYFTVGPEARVADYEREMQHALGGSAKVVRLWPRDFWDVPAR